MKIIFLIFPWIISILKESSTTYIHWSLVFAFVRVDYKLQRRTHIYTKWTIFMFTHIHNVKKKWCIFRFVTICVCMLTHGKINGQYTFLLCFWYRWPRYSRFWLNEIEKRKFNWDTTYVKDMHESYTITHIPSIHR